MEQRARARCGVWQEPFTPLRLLKTIQPSHRPYEFGDVTSNGYYEWFLQHADRVYGVAPPTSGLLKEFPPAQG